MTDDKPLIPTEKEQKRYNDFSIELDCPPGQVRPNDLIDGVLEGTGLEVSDFDTGAPFFGHQIWILKESAGKDLLFIEKKPVFKERITQYYNQGWIRYGTW